MLKTLQQKFLCLLLYLKEPYYANPTVLFVSVVPTLSAQAYVLYPYYSYHHQNPLPLQYVPEPAVYHLFHVFALTHKFPVHTLLRSGTHFPATVIYLFISSVVFLYLYLSQFHIFVFISLSYPTVSIHKQMAPKVLDLRPHFFGPKILRA